MDAWRYLRHRLSIGQTRSRDDSSLNATWLNLSASSPIEQTRLSDNDSHPSISSELLIEDEESNPMAKPNFAYKLTCSLTM